MNKLFFLILFLYVGWIGKSDNVTDTILLEIQNIQVLIDLYQLKIQKLSELYKHLSNSSSESLNSIINNTNISYFKNSTDQINSINKGEENKANHNLETIQLDSSENQSKNNSNIKEKPSKKNNITMNESSEEKLKDFLKNNKDLIISSNHDFQASEINLVNNEPRHMLIKKYLYRVI